MKPSAVKLQLPLAVGSVRVLDTNGRDYAKAPAAAPTVVNEELQKNAKALCTALSKAVEKVNLYGQNLFAFHREQIVSLAVQIAARILAKEIEAGQYAMENILVQAIREIPNRNILEIRLNPQDLKLCEQYLKNESIAPGGEIKLTADSSVGRSECVLITPDGILESRVHEHLREIEAAMQAAT